MPDERYASAEDLSRDLGRYLQHEPVEARADTLGYRTRKFLRRNRLATAAALIVATSVLGGLAIAIWQTGVAREQARIAQSESAKANAVKDFVLGLFQASDFDGPGGAARRDTTVAQLLDIGAARVAAGGLETQPEVRSELFDQLGILYLQIEAADKSEQMYRGLHAVRVQQFGEQDPRTIDAWIGVGTALRNQNKYEEAMRLYQQAVARLDAANLTAPAVRGRALLEMAYVSFRIAPNDTRGIAFAEQALTLLQPLPPDEKRYQAYLALGRAYESAGQLQKAVQHYSDGIAIASQVVGVDAVGVAGGTQMRGRVQMARGEFTRAEQDLARAVKMFGSRVGFEHRYYLDAASEYGDVLDRLGRWQEAEPKMRAYFDFVLRTRGSDSLFAANAGIGLARLLDRSGQPEAAIAAYQRVIAMTNVMQTRPGTLLLARIGVASSATSMGNLKLAEEAISESERLLPIAQADMRDVPDRRNSAEARLALVAAALAAKKSDRAQLDVENRRAAGLLAKLSVDAQGNRELFWRLRLSEAVAAASIDPSAAAAQLNQLLADIRRHPERPAYQHLEATALIELGQRLRATGEANAACQSLAAAAELHRKLMHPESDQRQAADRALEFCPPVIGPTR